MSNSSLSREPDSSQWSQLAVLLVSHSPYVVNSSLLQRLCVFVWHVLPHTIDPLLMLCFV